MSPSPLISILMPVYNEAPTIERAVNQVMAADLAEPYELIVVDDGSTDAAFGVRAFAGHTSHSFLFVLGNRMVTLVANLLFNVALDGLRVFAMLLCCRLGA